MLNLVLTCLLLGAALGLSLRRFILPYMAADDVARLSTPATMVASAVFLVSLGLTVSDKGAWAGSLTLAGGIVLALLSSNRRSRLMVVLSACCLLGYIALR